MLDLMKIFHLRKIFAVPKDFLKSQKLLYKLLFKFDIHNKKKDHFEIHILMIFEATLPGPKDR